MPRPDISDRLIHFTSGATEEAAFDTLCAILSDGALRGSADKIKSGDRCVCFTEAPLAALARGLVNLSDYSKYLPFGIVVEKTRVYAEGGRPVIYQSDAEYDLLPEALQWRHMRYEPIVIPPADRPTDFTWEREWRIKTEAFAVAPNTAWLVVPSSRWADRLRDTHYELESLLVRSYAQIMAPELAEQYRNAFPWRVAAIDSSG